MNMITIIIAVLAAAAAVFAALFFQGRMDIRKHETKSESLAKELSDLRFETARREAERSDHFKPLTPEGVVEFLKRERTGEVEWIEEKRMIRFLHEGDIFLIDCSRLPFQFILIRGYEIEGTGIRRDVLERAAVEVTRAIVMIKMNVSEGGYYEYQVVSTTHTEASLREDFDFLLSLFSDAERKLREVYWRIMEAEHPEECAEGQAASAQTPSPEEAVLRMAQMAGGSKIQS